MALSPAELSQVHLILWIKEITIANPHSANQRTHTLKPYHACNSMDVAIIPKRVTCKGCTIIVLYIHYPENTLNTEIAVINPQIGSMVKSEYQKGQILKGQAAVKILIEL